MMSAKCWGFFIPLPLVRISRNLSVLFVRKIGQFFNPPSPLCADVICTWSLASSVQRIHQGFWDGFTFIRTLTAKGRSGREGVVRGRACCRAVSRQFGTIRFHAAKSKEHFKSCFLCKSKSRTDGGEADGRTEWSCLVFLAVKVSYFDFLQL